MTKNIMLIVAVALCVAGPGVAAQKAKPKAPVGNLNTYTPDEEARAVKAVTDAGYTSPVIGSAQAGNFFIMAMKDGRLLQLTVTPTGQVYANNPVTK